METVIAFIKDTLATLAAGGWPDLGVWSYVLLALLVATEGPITTLIGAAAAAGGYLDIKYVLMAALIGNVAGDCFWYTLGYVNKLETLYRYGRWLGLRNHHIERLEAELQTHAVKLIILAKITFGLIVPTLVTAGLARVAVRRWLPAVLIVESVWTVLLVSVGFKAAGAITRVEHTLEVVGGVAMVLFLALVFWYARRSFRRNAHEDDCEPMASPVSVQESAPTVASRTMDDAGRQPLLHHNGKRGGRAVQPTDLRKRYFQAPALAHDAQRPSNRKAYPRNAAARHALGARKSAWP